MSFSSGSGGLTYKVLEPCEDPLMGIGMQDRDAVDMSMPTSAPEVESPLPVIEATDAGAASTETWWAVHDWESNDTLLKGEVAVMRVEDVHLVVDAAQPIMQAPIGVLSMTTYRLSFQPQQAAYAISSGVSTTLATVPLAMIERVEKVEGRWDRSYCLEVHTRDYRILRLEFPRADAMLDRAYSCLIGYVFPQRIDFMFAFFYSGRKPPTVPADIDGWNLYDGLRELQRLQIPNDLIRVTTVNKQYEVCDSYPSLVAVPSATSDYDLRKVSAFRKRGRFPILSWKHPTCNATVWRCSQPKVGWNQSRCSQDESMIDSILKTNPGQEVLPILDCRPKMNAVGNKLAGAGFESSEFYPDCSLTFLGIQNIHSVRDSAQKMAKLCRYEGTSGSSSSQFLSRLESSNWLSHQSDLIRAALLGVQQVHDHQQSILVHCSDGWDRTAGVACLLMACLDPYYRTIDGFLVLIEKEWLAAGHKFAERFGFDADHSNTQRAPVFLQFVESIWQITAQFPTDFEFNSRFLLALVDHSWSARFGTFLCNSQRERVQSCIRQRTVSLWTYLRWPSFRTLFSNPLFDPSDHILYPSASTSKIRLWEDFWLRSGLVEYPRASRQDAMPLRAVHPISTSTDILYQDTIWALRVRIEQLQYERAPSIEYDRGPSIMSPSGPTEALFEEERHTSDDIAHDQERSFSEIVAHQERDLEEEDGEMDDSPPAQGSGVVHERQPQATSELIQ